MMSILQWILLGSIFTLYLLFGGCVFMALEQGNEIQRLDELALLRKDIEGILFRLDQEFYNNETSPEILEGIRQAKQGVILRISDTCGGTNFLDVNSTQGIVRWSFYNSVFYAFTAVTTIGYGNLAPETEWSRIFTIIYALIGIPLNGVVLTQLSGVYNRKLVKIHKSADSKIAFAFNIMFYLIPGFLVFIIIPAGCFVVIEKWEYLDAIYFSFVTLTTIGFGDYVAGMGDVHSFWLWVYKIVIIIWIVFGLGYLVMILGFITKGITSKKVRTVLEKKLNRIRITKEKLAKDVEQMRKVVNELYITKTAIPGYLSTNESQVSLDYYLSSYQQNQFLRSKSFFIPRVSISGPVDMSLIRSFSESDIDRFNRNEGKLERRGSESVLAQLVASLEGTITNVLDAVADLDNLKAEPNNNETEPLDKNPGRLTSSLSETANTINEANKLRETDDNANLEQVVVHKSEVGPKPGILTKMGAALRRMSTSKPASGPPSRKVSRNDSETNFPQKSQLSPKPSYHVKRVEDLNEMEESDIEQTQPSCQNHSKCHRNGDLPRNLSHTSAGTSEGDDRKHFPKTGPPEHSRRHTTLDPYALAEILKVLDDVQEQLASHECFQRSMSTSDDEEHDLVGITNPGFVGSNESSPTLGHRRHMRNRKVGIFNPDFKYFSPDLTGASGEKRRELEHSIEPR